jgi:hypothetical protein
LLSAVYWRLQQRSPQDHGSDGEIDHQSRDVDQGRDEWCKVSCLRPTSFSKSISAAKIGTVFVDRARLKTSIWIAEHFADVGDGEFDTCFSRDWAKAPAWLLRRYFHRSESVGFRSSVFFVGLGKAAKCEPETESRQDGAHARDRLDMPNRRSFQAESQRMIQSSRLFFAILTFCPTVFFVGPSPPSFPQ